MDSNKVISIPMGSLFSIPYDITYNYCNSYFKNNNTVDIHIDAVKVGTYKVANWDCRG
jgi:hypothetical protein